MPDPDPWTVTITLTDAGDPLARPRHGPPQEPRDPDYRLRRVLSYALRACGLRAEIIDQGGTGRPQKGE